MKKLCSLILSAVILMGSAGPCLADGIRTFNSPVKVRRKLATQFNGSTEVFTTTDPTPAGTPLTLTSATGKAGMDGQVTLVFRSGISGKSITAFQWLQDNVDTSKSCWVRVAPSSTGTDVYTKTIDSDYTTVQFSLPEQAPFLIMSSSGVTGDVYTDSEAHPSNTGSTASGY